MARTLVERLEEHFFDTTGNIFAGTPFFALLENVILQQPDQNAIDARAKSAILNYAGLGFFYSKGRDYSRKKFNITKEQQGMHDMIYTFGVTLIVGPAIYLLSGNSLETSCIDGFWSSVAVIPIGYFIGHGIDLSKDLFGIKESDRKPAQLFRNCSTTTKQIIGAASIAGITALTAAIYQATPW
ncbi:MAG: hypothetical protein Q7R96_04245 [Nanoarchaeota archaeon]|nr:hypothetical protein [Nanoarchaeota archaeon]